MPTNPVGASPCAGAPRQATLGRSPMLLKDSTCLAVTVARTRPLLDTVLVIGPAVPHGADSVATRRYGPKLTETAIPRFASMLLDASFSTVQRNWPLRLIADTISGGRVVVGGWERDGAVVLDGCERGRAAFVVQPARRTAPSNPASPLVHALIEWPSTPTKTLRRLGALQELPGRRGQKESPQTATGVTLLRLPWSFLTSTVGGEPPGEEFGALLVLIVGHGAVAPRVGVEALIGAADRLEQGEGRVAGEELVGPLHEEEHRAGDERGVSRDAAGRRPGEAHQPEDGRLDPGLGRHEGEPEDGAHRDAPVADRPELDAIEGERPVG